MTALIVIFIVAAIVGGVAIRFESGSVLLSLIIGLAGVAMVYVSVVMLGGNTALSGLGGMVVGVAIITSPLFRRGMP